MGNTGFDSLLLLCPDRVSMYCYFHCYSRNADRTRGWERGFAVYKESPASTGLFSCAKKQSFRWVFFKRLAVSKGSAFGRLPQQAKPFRPEGAPQGAEFAKCSGGSFCKEGAPCKRGRPLIHGLRRLSSLREGGKHRLTYASFFFSPFSLLISSSSSTRYATLPTSVLGSCSRNSISYGMAYFAMFLRQ